MPYFTLWILDFSIPSGCQTVCIQIRPDILSGLIWVQTVCKGYQQTTKVAPSRQKVKYKTTCWNYFLAKTLAKVNFIWLPTFPIWLKCWLQQILSLGKPWKWLHRMLAPLLILCKFRLNPQIECWQLYMMLTSKSRSMSPKSNNFFSMYHCCLIGSMVKIHTLLKEIWVKTRQLYKMIMI